MKYANLINTIAVVIMLGVIAIQLSSIPQRLKMLDRSIDKLNRTITYSETMLYVISDCMGRQECIEEMTECIDRYNTQRGGHYFTEALLECNNE